MFLIVLSLALLALPATAFAAPKIAKAAWSNQIAYELKSGLSSTFTCQVDQAGCWATLTVSGAKGVVKTVYSGPINVANAPVSFPAWNGLDASGRRMSTATYDWKLTVTKGNQASTATGKIAVSKIYFNLRGSLDINKSVTETRYMINEATAFYIWARTPGPDPRLSLEIHDFVIKDAAGTKVRPPEFITIPNGTTVRQWYSYPWIIPSRGNREITIANTTRPMLFKPSGPADYYMTVIQ